MTEKKTKKNKARLVCYVDDDVIEFYREAAALKGMQPSTIGAQILSATARNPHVYAFSTSPDVFDIALRCIGRHPSAPKRTLEHPSAPQRQGAEAAPPGTPQHIISSSIHQDHQETMGAEFFTGDVEDVEDPEIGARVEELAIALAAPPSFSPDAKLDDASLSVVIALELMAAESKKGTDRDKLRSLARHVRRRGELSDKQRAMLHEITGRTREWCLTAASPRAPETGACLGAVDWIRKEHEGGPHYAKRWATYLSKEKAARRSA